LPIANCRLPIDMEPKVFQSAIGNRKSAMSLFSI
jgi:hypothetical protein